jgi:hypothetical protein
MPAAAAVRLPWGVGFGDWDKALRLAMLREFFRAFLLFEPGFGSSLPSVSGFVSSFFFEVVEIAGGFFPVKRQRNEFFTLPAGIAGAGAVAARRRHSWLKFLKPKADSSPFIFPAGHGMVPAMAGSPGDFHGR